MGTRVQCDGQGVITLEKAGDYGLLKELYPNELKPILFSFKAEVKTAGPKSVVFLVIIIIKKVN